MLKTLAKLFFILITSMLLIGCGFRLNTTKILPPQLNQVYYQTEHPYEKFELYFKKKLQASGAVLLSCPKKAAPIIHISSIYGFSNSSPASSTQARIYNLSYTVTINISDSHNQPILAPQTASVTRSIVLQANEVFETTTQADVVKQEMIQELSTKLFNILGSPRTFQALEKMNTLNESRISGQNH